MGSSDLEKHREPHVTMRFVIASEDPTEHLTTGASSPGRVPWLYPLVLALAVLSALIPFFFLSDLMNAVPRRFVVAWYGLLALVAGWFGIRWIILLTARLVLSTKGEADVHLDEEAGKKVFEILHSAGRGTGT